MDSALRRCHLNDDVRRAIMDQRIEPNTVSSLTTEHLISLGIDTIGDQIRFREACKEESRSSATHGPIRSRSTARVNNRRQVFGTIPQRQIPGIKWTQKFICLDDPSYKDVMLTAEQREHLMRANLWEKKIVFNDIQHMTLDEFNEKICDGFPSLSTSGFDLCLASGSGRHVLSVVHHGNMSVTETRSIVGQSKLYIRPHKKLQVGRDNVYPMEIGNGFVHQSPAIERRERVNEMLTSNVVGRDNVYTVEMDSQSLNQLTTTERRERVNEVNVITSNLTQHGSFFSMGNANDLISVYQQNVTERPERTQHGNCLSIGNDSISVDEPTVTEMQEMVARDNVYHREMETQYLNQPTTSDRHESDTDVLSPNLFHVTPDTGSGDEISVYDDLPPVQQLIWNSISSSVGTDVPELPPTMAQLLGKEANAIAGDPLTVVVDRSEVLQSIISVTKKRHFTFNRPVNVVFAGEYGDDNGGPKRELMRLLMNSVAVEMGILEGNTKEKFLTHNIKLLTSRHYFLAGQLVAWSLRNGGPGLPCLSPLLFKLMMRKENQKLSDTDALLGVDSIVDDDIRNALAEIMSVNSEEVMNVLKEKYCSLLIDAGINDVYQMNLGNKNRFISDFMLHYFFFRIATEIKEFTDGLGSIWHVTCSNPDVMRPLFVTTNEALTMMKLRAVYGVIFSETGSSRRRAENTAIFNFESMLNDCENGIFSFQLSDLLIFWTGASDVPPMGFPEPAISDDRQPANRPLAVAFDHVVGHWPHASTCGLQLWLPVGLNSDEFAELFAKALKCVEFGIS